MDDFARKQDAVEEFQKTLKKDPNLGATRYSLAMAYGDMKRYDLAINEMKEAERLQYNAQGDADKVGPMWIARWQQTKNNTDAGGDEALQTLSEALKKYHDDYDIITVYVPYVWLVKRTEART